MYYVVSIYGKLMKNKFGVLQYTGDIEYQGTNLTEAIRICNVYGSEYEVCKLDETESNFIKYKY